MPAVAVLQSDMGTMESAVHCDIFSSGASYKYKKEPHYELEDEL